MALLPLELILWLGGRTGPELACGRCADSPRCAPSPSPALWLVARPTPPRGRPGLAVRRPSPRQSLARSTHASLSTGARSPHPSPEAFPPVGHRAGDRLPHSQCPASPAAQEVLQVPAWRWAVGDGGRARHVVRFLAVRPDLHGGAAWRGFGSTCGLRPRRAVADSDGCRGVDVGRVHQDDRLVGADRIR